MQEPSGYTAVLGDLVRSRMQPERADLQHHLSQVLERVNERFAPVDPLQITIGDEFQGLFASIQDALGATLWVRAWMKPRSDVRFGIGWGKLATYDAARSPFGQDGPAWWAAREALDEAHAFGDRHGVPRGWRTVVRLGASDAGSPPERSDVAPPAEVGVAGLPPPEPMTVDLEGLLNAFLALRDHLVADLDEEDVEVLGQLESGIAQRQIAERLGISQQAVSSRAHSRGLFALLASQRQVT